MMGFYGPGIRVLCGVSRNGRFLSLLRVFFPNIIENSAALPAIRRTFWCSAATTVATPGGQAQCRHYPDAGALSGKKAKPESWT